MIISYLNNEETAVQMKEQMLNQMQMSANVPEQQKIALLRALLKDPDVIILDEPTTALDQITTTNLLQYLKT